MAAVFGSATRATFAVIIFAFEITRDYNAILPLMLVCVIAYGVTIPLMRNTIVTEKLARRGLRIPQDYETDILQRIDVSAVMDRDPRAVASTMLVGELADRIAKGDEQATRHQGFPIVDENQFLAGIVTWDDVAKVIANNVADKVTVHEAGTSNLVVTYPDELMHDAVLKMLNNDIGRLPVVDRSEPRRLVGYLGRPAIIEARLRRLHDESVREPGWLAKPFH